MMDRMLVKPLDSGSSTRNRETSLDISKRNYERGATKLALIINQISALPIPQETVQAWRILLVSMRVVDDKLDHIVEAGERLKFIQKIMSFLAGEIIDFSDDKDLEKALLDTQKLLEELPQNQKRFFLNSLRMFFKVTEKIKKEESPKEFIDLTRLEGQITAKIFLSFLQDEFRLSKDYHTLVHVLTRLGRVANSFDSFIDLPTDHKNQQTRIRPTMVNRVLFFGSILSDGLSMLRKTGLSKDLVKELLLSTGKVITDTTEK